MPLRYPAPMFHDARSLPPEAVLQGDVAIIGAGAAGITLARALRGRGHTVLLLFKGNAESAADLRFVRHVSADDSNLNGFENLLATGRPRCGQIRDSQREFIFGPDSASIGSVALVPLAGADASAGLLVLGSVNRERFHPGMSTDFLQLLGELISDALARD